MRPYYAWRIANQFMDPAEVVSIVARACGDLVADVTASIYDGNTEAMLDFIPQLVQAHQAYLVTAALKCGVINAAGIAVPTVRRPNA